MIGASSRLDKTCKLGYLFGMEDGYGGTVCLAGYCLYTEQKNSTAYIKAQLELFCYEICPGPYGGYELTRHECPKNEKTKLRLSAM